MNNTRKPQVDSITVGDGKYTVQLDSSEGRNSFTAMRNGLPWRDMSGDGDGLMLAMFHHILEQRARIDKLECQTAPASSTMQRWVVEAGEAPAIENEPTYVMNVDHVMRVVEVVPAGLTAGQHEGMPQIAVGFEINKGLPRLLVFTDAAQGEVLAQYHGSPDGRVVPGEPDVDVHVVGEQFRERLQQSDAPAEAPGSGS